jgi:hypothetical protein
MPLKCEAIKIISQLRESNQRRRKKHPPQSVCVYIHHNSAGCASSSHVCLICVDAHPSKGPNPPTQKREGGRGAGPKKRKIGGRTDGPRGVLNIKADAEREREKTIEALLLLLPLIFFFPSLPPCRDPFVRDFSSSVPAPFVAGPLPPLPPPPPRRSPFPFCIDTH